MLKTERRWYVVGQMDIEISSTLISGDGEVFGALVNGRPTLKTRSAQTISLPAALDSETYVAAALSPDGKRLALASKQQLSVLEISSGAIQTASLTDIFHLTWQPEGKHIAVGHNDNKISLCTPSLERISEITLPAPRHRFWQIAFGSQDNLFAASSYPPPNWLSVLSPSQSVAKKIRLPEGRYVHGLASASDRIIAMLSDHCGRFELSEYSCELEQLRLIALETEGTSLSATPEGNWLAIGTVNGEAWILDGQTLQIMGKQPLYTAPVRAIAACDQDCLVAGAKNSEGQLAMIEWY